MSKRRKAQLKAHTERRASTQASVSPAAPRNRQTFRQLLVLLAAAALTLGAAVQLHRLWLKLPGPSVARLDWRAVRQARTAHSGDAYEGLLLASLSTYFTDALHHPAQLPQVLDETRKAAGHLQHTQLGRLQLAALQMLQFEHEGLPIAQWWPKLQGYLDGLSAAQFRHFMSELLDAESRIYVNLGLPAGTAAQLALRDFGCIHGPFLEYFVAQMRRIAEERRQAGDPTTADRCQKLTDRLLREWVLESGPAALRLLAAELLAEKLESRDATTGGIAQKCRAWRAAYHAAAVALPAPGPMLLRVGDEPEAASTKPQRRFLGLAFLLGPATALAASVALIGAAVCPLAGSKLGGAVLRVLLAALGVALAASVAWILLAGLPGAVFSEQFRLQFQDVNEAPTAWLGALGGLALALAAGGAWALLRRRSRTRRVAFAAAAATTWLIAGVLFLAVALGAGAPLSGYQAALARPLDEQLAALAPPNADGLLDELRAWNP